MESPTTEKTMICKAREVNHDGSVTTYWRNGRRHATATSAHRGGCLYAGVITLKDLDSAQTRTVESTTCWDRQPGETCPYLDGLYEKHFARPAGLAD
jgi:hypothetical protein